MIIKIKETVETEYEIEVNDGWPTHLQTDRKKVVAHIAEACREVGFDSITMKTTSKQVERFIDGEYYPDI